MAEIEKPELIVFKRRDYKYTHFLITIVFVHRKTQPSRCNEEVEFTQQRMGFSARYLWLECFDICSINDSYTSPVQLLLLPTHFGIPSISLFSTSSPISHQILCSRSRNVALMV